MVLFPCPFLQLYLCCCCWCRRLAEINEKILVLGGKALPGGEEDEKEEYVVQGRVAVLGWRTALVYLK